MRELINIILLQEDAVQLLQNTNAQELEAFKQAIAGRIKELPPDDATIKALREIEDLLKHVHAGGKVGIINGQLQQLKDPTVTAAQKELARYILSLDFSPEERQELFTLWGADEIVNRAKLLSPGKHNFSEIINGYDKPKIREFVDDMMRIAALGQGKGEFGLSVLSKNINKPPGKGDLVIDGKKIEAKTTDGGAGRFTDQEVRPGEGFEAAARKLNQYVQQLGYNMPKSGLSMANTVKVGQEMEKKFQANYFKLVEIVITLIFNSKQNVTPIMQAIKSGNTNTALQEYAKANFNYYMSMKDDEGVLYINLAKDPITTVFFRNADELAKSGLRLHAGTIYITSISDVRLPYPQMEIVDTSGGAGAVAPANISKAASKAAKVALAQPTAAAATTAPAKRTTAGTPRARRA
jgi:hypothetical protein